MKPNSIFVATFIKGNNNYAGKKWHRGFVTYTLERMTRMVNEFGLKCHSTDWCFRDQTLILITHPETEVSIPDSNLVGTLKLEVNYYKDELQRLGNHPYIKFGVKVNRGIRRIRKLLHC